MTTYIYRNGTMVDKATGAPMVAPDAPLATPMVLSDTQGYRSPINGAWIEGRRARRYDLESNNCVDANDLPRKTDGTLRNANFAAKHGLQHLLQK